MNKFTFKLLVLALLMVSGYNSTAQTNLFENPDIEAIAKKPSAYCHHTIYCKGKLTP